MHLLKIFINSKIMRTVQCPLLLAFACSLFAVCSTYTIVPDGTPENSNIDVSPFVRIGKGSYYIETKLKTNWFDANDRCHHLDAELVSFETLEEWNLINSYLRHNSIEDNYWTSGNDLAKQHTHIWLSNGLPITLVDIWYPGEPNNEGGNERCDELGYFRRGDPSEKRALNDEKCSTARRYICEARSAITPSILFWFGLLKLSN